jgi:glycosyltransferase involved in cell wall biosynthesis
VDDDIRSLSAADARLPDLTGVRVAVVNAYLEGRERDCERSRYPRSHLWGADSLAAAGAEVEYLRPPQASPWYRCLAAVSRRVGGRLGRLDYDWWLAGRARRFHLIYGQNDRLLLTQLLRAVGLVRSPVVYWAYVPFRPSPVWKLRGLWARWPCSAGIDAVLCLTRATEESYRRRWQNKPVRHVEWGADSIMFDGSELPGEFFFACGRTNRDYSTLLAAAARTSAPVVIVAALRDIGGTRLPANVRLVEGPPDASTDRGIPYATLISDYYARSKAVLICRRDVPGDTSGLTNLLEALSMGRPVAMTRTGSLDIDIEAIGVGRFVAPGDVEGWARLMTEWSAESPSLAAMRVRAREVVERRYNCLTHGRAVVTFLHEILENQRPPGGGTQR